MTVLYRTARLDDLARALDWAAEEGWNPGVEDAPAFWATDPDGFFVAQDGDTLVAAISVVNHNDTFAFLGLYIVRPAYRGQGIGLALWTHALAHAGSRVVGLDGVPEQQQNYVASGFAHAGATTRFAGPLDRAKDDAIRPVRRDEIPALIAREAALSGTPKAAYLGHWFQDTKTRQTLVLDETGTLTGACTLRRCRDGTKIGPLWAESTEGAERLLRHAATLSPGPVIIDVPQSATDLAGLCTGLHMAPGFETARMYRGHFAMPEPPIFAVTSLELG